MILFELRCYIAKGIKTIGEVGEREQNKNKNTEAYSGDGK